MGVVNRQTGQEPTEAEVKALRQRALEIFRNPYASPEQLAWAMEVYPEGIVAIAPRPKPWERRP